MENLNGKKGWGLVLSGGGGKGSFQVGAFKALNEAGYDKDITAISGASVGIVNALLFIMRDVDKAQKVWKGIEPLMFLEPKLEATNTPIVIHEPNYYIDEVVNRYNYAREINSNADFARNKEGFFTRDGFVKLINENLDLDKIPKSEIDLYTDMCLCKNDELLLEYVQLNGKTPKQIMDILLAASAIPYVYDAVYYDNNYYRDGGIIDNMPIKPLYDEGYRNIIVVGLKTSYTINYEEYPDCNFIFIKPSHGIGEFMDGTLDFTSEGAKFRIALGYRNAARILEAVKTGKINEPDFATWLSQMSFLDYEQAKYDIKQEKLMDQKNYHMDKLKSIYDKYL